MAVCKCLATILLQEPKTLIFDYIKIDFIYSCFVCESVALTQWPGL